MDGMGQLSHLDPTGSARMVDVAEKAVTRREAAARARVRMSSQTAALVQAGDAPKGDVLGTARLAGLQAAKRTSELIPLCHQLPLDFVGVDIEVRPEEGLVEIVAQARATARTGVEMEALTAAAVAALTIYDMTKGVERGVEIVDVVLLSKTGGRRDWRREDAP
jgi:cyclic pyranopterin phosphate synthase